MIPVRAACGTDFSLSELFGETTLSPSHPSADIRLHLASLPSSDTVRNRHGRLLISHLYGVHFRRWPRECSLARTMTNSNTRIGIAAVVGPMAIGLLHAPPTRAQSPVAGNARPQFEVASIKPNKSGRGFDARFEGGRYTARHASLRILIEGAYQVKDYQVSGAPDWWNSETFDIVAKAPPERSPEKSQAHFLQSLLMLRTLLEDRFKLAVHRDTKVVQGYALTVAKTGHKLPKSPDTDDETGLSGGRGKMSGHHITSAQIADTLSARLNIPVKDATELQGFFEVELQWAPDELSATANADGPTIFTALQEQLGLKLESRKVPVEILVIDHLEKIPTEN
jgi:uncharacterized protein (TIGR03435 family)